jgi:hypothetical protein
MAESNSHGDRLGHMTPVPRGLALLLCRLGIRTDVPVTKQTHVLSGFLVRNLDRRTNYSIRLCDLAPGICSLSFPACILKG